MAEKKARDLFASRLGILAATLGSAVGLGNIWKFPALTGQNGGASFLLIYVLSTLVVGLPLMIAEMVIGRSTRTNAFRAFTLLTAKPFWWLIGGMGIVAATIILAFYSDVAGWVFAYIPKAFSGAISTQDPQEASAVFASLLESPLQSLFWQWLVLCATAAIIMRGASAGIEKATRILIPLLFLLLIVVCIRSLTLPNAVEGLRFLFMPDFSRIDSSVILMALGLSFFKMSIGFGCMITYGSYFRADTNVPMLATRVMFCDLLVSILAGIAVFPAVFSFGFEPTAGTSLLFLTIPAVFSSMPGGTLFTALFFILSAVASTGAMLSLMEVPVVWAAETFRVSRRRATLFITAGIILAGMPAALGTNVLSHVSLFGLSLFDMYDFLSSNLLLPVGGLLLSLFVGYVWNRDSALDVLSNGGALHNRTMARLLLFCCKTITPVLIALILLHGLHVL